MLKKALITITVLIFIAATVYISLMARQEIISPAAQITIPSEKQVEDTEIENPDEIETPEELPNEDSTIPDLSIIPQEFEPFVPENPIMCTMELVTGLHISLEDQNGQAIHGATITSNGQTFLNFSNGEYQGLHEQEGYFEYTIIKDGFIGFTGDVTITGNECHVTTVDKTIQLVPTLIPEYPIMCTMEARVGLHISLEDENGQVIHGAMITANGQTFENFVDGEYNGLYEQAGYFEYTIIKEGFIGFTGDVTITETEDKCHVIPVNKTITLISEN